MSCSCGTRAWSPCEIPDQKGRVALITGANTGTGFETARSLAEKGAHVILACRNAERAQAALQRISALHPEASLEFLPLDLGSLESIRSAARLVRERHPRLDLLINNAGVMLPPKSRTQDGFELQFGTNHLGHFALTGLVLESLLATPGSRIVTMSSNAHKYGAMGFEDLQFERGYRAWAAYCQSKLANLLFTFELRRRLEGTGTLAMAAHPGWSYTELARHATRNPIVACFNSTLGRILAQPAAQGAQPLLRAAVDPAVSSGDYFGPSGPGEWRGSAVRVSPHRRALDETAQQRLWQISEQLSGVSYPL
jgi:NAD(P)-dependent dehydrogenase (short-subunit alcohol dehydrogenase family)